jgi:hypothetical protein
MLTNVRILIFWFWPPMVKMVYYIYRTKVKNLVDKSTQKSDETQDLE